MSIRSVDMQHTLQQTAQVERIQATERTHVDQQGQQQAQQLERAEALRQQTVGEMEQASDDRRVDDEAHGKEQGKRRRRPGHDDDAQDDEPTSDLTAGEVHLIDIRV